MRKVLEDILDHTLGLGFISEVKITGDEEATLVEAMDEKQLVVIKGYLKNVVPEFQGEFGINGLARLRGLVESPDYKSDKATINIEVDKDRNGNEYPARAMFEAPGLTPFKHTFMNPEIVQEQFDFMGANWTISFVPTKSIISRFRYYSTIYADSSNLFSVLTSPDGELIFNVGDADGGGIIIHQEKGLKFRDTHYWLIDVVLSALKLKEGEAEMNLLDDSKAAALEIKMESDVATWHYIFPSVKT